MYVSHLLCDDEMREWIRQTNMGVETIEFSIAENLDHLDETLRFYEKRLAFMECEDLTLHGPFLDLNPAAFDSMVQEATFCRFEQAYKAARSLGAKKVIYHTCFVPTVYFLEGWAPRVIDFFERFLEKKSENVEILIENVLDPLPEPLAEIAQQISHPAFGVCLDLGHANCYSKIPVEQWIEILQPYLRHVHMHDNFGDKDSHLAVGSGKLYTEKIVSYIRNTDDKNCTIECNTMEAVKKSHDFLKSVEISKKRGI